MRRLVLIAPGSSPRSAPMMQQCAVLSFFDGFFHRNDHVEVGRHENRDDSEAVPPLLIRSLGNVFGNSIRVNLNAHIFVFHSSTLADFASASKPFGGVIRRDTRDRGRTR